MVHPHPRSHSGARASAGAILAGLWVALSAGAVAAVSILSALESQPAGAPKAPAPSPESAPRGWLAQASAPGAKEKVKLHAAAAEFALPKDQTLYPGLPASGLTVTYSSTLLPDKGGRYRLWVLAQGGTAKLTVYGARGAGRIAQAESMGRHAAGEWFASDGSPVTVSVTFQRAGAGEARLQTLWERQGTSAAGGFVREPIPMHAVRTPEYAARDIALAQASLHGRMLLGEMKCTACHTPEDGAMTGVKAAQAPLLGEVGRRASPEWIREWVSNPQKVKPGSYMPDLLGDSPKDEADAEAITHFLVSLGGPLDWEPVAREEQVIDLGQKLYHSVGCVACHGALEPAAKVFGEATLNTAMPATPPPSPFGDIGGKWRPAALSEYLQDPLRTHPSGRMPSMSLSAQEADLITTYLIDAWGQSAGSGQSGFKIDPAKVDVGRAAFSARGCANCHEIGHNLPNIPGGLKTKRLSALKADRGCLAPEPRSPAPRFTLSDQDRAALGAAIDAIGRIVASGGTARAPIDEGRRTFAALGCIQCHERGGEGGIPDDLKLYFRTVDDTELGDEGRLPPHLDGVGFKLHASWMRSVLCDHARARPYMAARMPQFGEKRVGELGSMLAMMDGVIPGVDAPEPRSTDEMVVSGRTLVGEKGLNCISCHTYDGKTTGTPGPEITAFAERLRYEWWKPYAMEPTRFKPGTRMTAFFREGGSPVPTIYGGDPDRQTDALWAYFNTGEFGPAPVGLPTGTAMPVPIGDKPVVFRTFLKEAGSRGIAVGFPIGTHFGFNAEEVRLVEAWQGDFVDAGAAWKGRGGTVATEQGSIIWKSPGGPPLLITPERPASWPTETGAAAGYAFRGYRYEPHGAPVFLYDVWGVSVEERFEPAPDRSIKRTFTVQGADPGATVWIRSDGVTGSVTLANARQNNSEQGLLGFTPADAAKPMSFAVTVKPEGRKP